MATAAVQAPRFAPPTCSLAASADRVVSSRSDLAVLQVHWEVRRAAFHNLTDADYRGDDKLNPRWGTIDRAERAILYTDVDEPQVAVWRILIAWAHMAPSSDVVEGLVFDGDIDGIYALRDTLNWSEKMMLASILQLIAREG